MTISYQWLCEYLPEKPSPAELSRILTSIGLEVETMEPYESVRGSLQGLIVGEVVACDPHPGADKLKITRVRTGGANELSIVCGAPNVAKGQKVAVAPVGVTIYPVKGDPVQMKVAKIRGVDSHGMICAEDEIGLGSSHEGILVLPATWETGRPLAEYVKPYRDTIYEIGLTPNRMDAMSHLGVARDVCAYLSHHRGQSLRPLSPSLDSFTADQMGMPVTVTIEDPVGCERFSGVSIRDIQIGPSPQWMQDKLRAIGVRPINNIVDITNFVLHETGQPLHAYDLDRIAGNQVIVKRVPAGTTFVTLDERKRSLFEEDLMICNAEECMCIAGVFGGLTSGVQEHTKNIFLESAWFNPGMVRRTSFLHNLRTEAAIHFEKGMDISGTVPALQRAAILIRELAGGRIASPLIDNYPSPRPKKEVRVSYAYLHKISGKQYSPRVVTQILQGLEFDIVSEGPDEIVVAVPFHKPDIAFPADIAEEIMRMDGYDQIPIPTAITISPSIESRSQQEAYREKIAGWLVGLGFSEIFTNSITNSAYYREPALGSAVRMINNLSSALDVMRLSLLETGLEALAYNINRKNGDLQFFEFGKSYHKRGVGDYEEKNHLALFVTGSLSADSWKAKSKPADIFHLKGICAGLLPMLGIREFSFDPLASQTLATGWSCLTHGMPVLEAGRVDDELLRRFDIRQPVYFADIHWDAALEHALRYKPEFAELPKQLPVFRDLAMVVGKSVHYEEVEKAAKELKLEKLEGIRLFDIFESEKLGPGKKSFAISLSFVDEEKTLTDKEIDHMMGRIILQMEKSLGAEIRGQ